MKSCYSISESTELHYTALGTLPTINNKVKKVMKDLKRSRRINLPTTARAISNVSVEH
jgi:hypothetical protein